MASVSLCGSDTNTQHCTSAARCTWLVHGAKPMGPSILPLKWAPACPLCTCSSGPACVQPAAQPLGRPCHACAPHTLSCCSRTMWAGAERVQRIIKLRAASKGMRDACKLHDHHTHVLTAKAHSTAQHRCNPSSIAWQAVLACSRGLARHCQHACMSLAGGPAA